MKSKPILYLIDGSSYIYRAYYALRHLSSHKGFPTNAIFGFTKMLLKVLKDIQPDHVAMIFDAGRSTFRHQLYPAYKANRIAMPDDLRLQLQPIKDIVAAFNIPCLELAGYEADDIIGTIVADCRERGMEAVIVTSDKDLMQLVREDVTLLDTMKDQKTGVPEVLARFGVPPERVVDVLGLCGDTSDNIPGVPGIGEKTAIKLLAQYGSLDELLKHVGDLKGKVAEQMAEYKEQAILSRMLATIDCRVPIQWSYEDFELSPPDIAALSVLFKEFGFTALMKELTSQSVLPTERYGVVANLNELHALVREATAAETVAIEILGAPSALSQLKICGIALSYRRHESWYLPVHAPADESHRVLPLKDVLLAINPLFTSTKVKKRFHDLKAALKMIWLAGADISAPVEDLMIESYLLNPSRTDHSLESIAIEFLDHKKSAYHDLVGKGKDKLLLEDVAVDAAARYACEIADVIFLMGRELLERLETSGMAPLLETVEMPLVRVLATMERCGVRLDLDLLHDISSSLTRELQAVETTIFGLSEGPFNINSPKQLGEVLFERLKLPAGRRTKTGWSTDIDVLTHLAEIHPLPREILRYRTLSKLKATYADALPKLVDKETGCIHTTYNQAVTNTGRLSSSDPNLQNIPVRSAEGRKIRQAFIPQQGFLLLAADYSQIELRVLAHLSKDDVLMDAFAKGEDVHRRTASEVFGVITAEVTPEMRRQAKTINFGVIYGQSPFGLANELGISQKLAKEFIDSYFGRHIGARRFLDACIAEAEANGFVTTILGRKLPIPDIKSPSFQLRSFAQRNAVNYPIQGSAADIIKVAMVNINARMAKEHLSSRMLMQVHDELVFEVEPTEKELMENLVRSEMERAVRLDVPVKVDMRYGANWHEAH